MPGSLKNSSSEKSPNFPHQKLKMPGIKFCFDRKMHTSLESLLYTKLPPLYPSADIPHVGTQKDIYGLRFAQNTIAWLIMKYILPLSS